ncbi:hypothetical protein [Wolbachia endosymbiont (group A) of Cheilosia soror]|nr:hypothetical protein [Wolbachia endosymbiont (group A) of Cheilosia soror]
MRAISTRKVSFQCLYDVIPVLDTGIQKSLLVNKQTSMESS